MHIRLCATRAFVRRTSARSRGLGSRTHRAYNHREGRLCAGPLDVSACRSVMRDMEPGGAYFASRRDRSSRCYFLPAISDASECALAVSCCDVDTSGLPPSPPVRAEGLDARLRDQCRPSPQRALVSERFCPPLHYPSFNQLKAAIFPPIIGSVENAAVPGRMGQGCHNAKNLDIWQSWRGSSSDTGSG